MVQIAAKSCIRKTVYQVPTVPKTIFLQCNMSLIINVIEKIFCSAFFLGKKKIPKGCLQYFS